MGEGFRATHVISWGKTLVDGQWSAPIHDLRPGASWMWSGDPVRIDRQIDSGHPDSAEDDAQLRRRAAQAVRRLLGAADLGLSHLPPRAEPDFPATATPERGFVLTDGLRTWSATVVGTGAGRLPLVVFVGDMPPRDSEVWVVGHDLVADGGGIDTDGGAGRMDTARRGAIQMVQLPEGDAPGGVICFTPGTMILCEDGPRPVESISEGTRLQTKDNGCQEVLWKGQRRLTGARIFAMPHLAPVRLRAGALDLGVPDAGLLVSPDHRIVLRGPRARRLFNTEEVLVAASDLVNGDSITIERSLRELSYIHLLLPAHEIVFANSVETESFHPASASLKSMEEGERARLMARLPVSVPQAYGPFARRVLTRTESAIAMHDVA